MQRTVDELYTLLSNFIECAGYEISDDLSVKRLSPVYQTWMPSEVLYKEVEQLLMTHGLDEPHDCIKKFIDQMNTKRVMAADWEARFKQWLNEFYELDEVTKFAF